MTIIKILILNSILKPVLDRPFADATPESS